LDDIPKKDTESNSEVKMDFDGSNELVAPSSDSQQQDLKESPSKIE
jgi:hypothetical protein